MGAMFEIDEFESLIDKKLGIAQGQFMAALWGEFMENTPYYSGTLKKGWNLTEGIPSFNVPKQMREPGSYPTPTMPKLDFNKPHALFFLTNSVKYLENVDAGFHGNDANWGFIQKSIDNAIETWNGYGSISGSTDDSIDIYDSKFSGGSYESGWGSDPADSLDDYEIGSGDY